MVGLVGQQLRGGQYTVERKLGQGRFGVTYLASDRNDNRLVIKTLNDDLLNQLSQSEIARLQDKFWQEAVKLAQCKHPHIVRVKDSFKEGQRVCLVMDYIEGQDLASFNKIWDEKEALHYIRQIASALIVVHDNNFVHRDVRPANILLRKGKREAVLIDFGLALGFDSPLTTVNPTTADGFTPLELYHPDAGRGAYTDVYSLAATLYYLLTGTVPPSARDRSIATVILKRPKEINPNISDRTSEAIFKGMELAPEARPLTVQEWLDLLGLKRRIPFPWKQPRWAVILEIIGIVGVLAGVISASIDIIEFRQKKPSPPSTQPTPTESPRTDN